MGRESLMKKQRARLDARRKARKEARRKKEDEIKKYGSGSTKATTRDTSKGQSRKAQQIAKYGSGTRKAVTRNTALDKAIKATSKAVQPKSKAKKQKPETAVDQAVKPKSKPSGSGVTGSFRKSNPASPTVTAKTKKGSRARVKKEDPRETARKRNLREAQTAKARRERKEQFTEKSYGGHPINPPKNPKEGDTYRKPFGPLMIFKNGKFVRA